MIRIAICDDDTTCLVLIKEKVKRWFEEHHCSQNCLIETFSNGKELLPHLRETSFDLFILDLEMPKMNGLEVAQQIRTLLPFTTIIFLTSHIKFALDGYKVQALRYITKDRIDQELPEALQTAYGELMRMDAGSLSVSHYNNFIRVPFKDIVYVRHTLRNTHIITSTLGDIRDNRGLNAIYDEIMDERFLFIDRGVFVNIDYIRRIDGNLVSMRNGEVLSISRQKLPVVKETLNRIWGK